MMVCCLSLFPGQGRGFNDDLTEVFHGKKRSTKLAWPQVGTPHFRLMFFVEHFDEDEPDGLWPFRELVLWGV